MGEADRIIRAVDSMIRNETDFDTVSVASFHIEGIEEHLRSYGVSGSGGGDQITYVFGFPVKFDDHLPADRIVFRMGRRVVGILDLGGENESETL